jgi:superfamily I DNA and/or RNA helicase
LIIYTKDTHDDSPLTIYRSVEGNHMRSIDIDKNNGKYNQRELDIIEHILREEFHSHKTLEHVGIITPFRKQVEKANEKFNNSFEVNTVHKFQ